MAKVDVYFEPGDNVPEAVALLLEIAGHDGSRVVWVPGSNHVITDDDVAAEYEQARLVQAEPDAPAPKRRGRPRKVAVTVEKENADG